MRQKNIPRGIRNNNPLNIRIGNVWLGEVKEPTDPDFEQFVSMKYGLRAAFVLLRRYICHYKRTSVAAVIAAWAPNSENDTARYIDMVCQLSGISPDTQLDYFDCNTMVKLVMAMARVECGQDIPESTVREAYLLA